MRRNVGPGTANRNYPVRMAGVSTTAQRRAAQWQRIAHAQDVAAMTNLLADDVVFHSPVVHTPQSGNDLTAQYLAAAFAVLFNPSFEYVRTIAEGDHAVMEFTVTIDGVAINGVDLVTWNHRDEICEFKVMLRPLKAINLVHGLMGAELQRSR